MEIKARVFRTKRSFWGAVAFFAFLFVFSGANTSKSEVASGVIVPDGYEATVVINLPTGLRANDVTFAPWGEMVVPIVNSTRQPCDSFIASVSPDGVLGHFAEICVDNPVLAAFGPLTGDLLYFLEGAGFGDNLYTVPSYGTGADVRVVNGGYVVTSDMAFGPDGNLYVADIYFGTITKVAPNGTSSIFSAGFTVDKSGYGNKANIWIGLEFDPFGNLLVADSKKQTIFRLSPTGSKTILTTQVPYPGGMAFGPDGNLYVGDISSGNIYAVSLGGSATKFASGLYQPLDMAFGQDGALYILEWMNPRVVFGPNRIVRIAQNVIDATVDLDPDTINPKSSGNYITCYVELPDGFDVGEIDPSTLAVIGVNRVPVKFPIMAVGPTEIGDYDGDGVADLTVKFDRATLTGLLGTGINKIAVSGYMSDGIEFRGIDSVRVLPIRGRSNPRGLK